MHHHYRRKFLPLVSVGLAVVALSGCATMSETACLSADWYAIGLEDGVAGRSMSHLSGHRKQCDDFGVSPDVQAYQQGRFEGLDYYCTLANGLQVGKRGQAYGNVCPSEMQHYFLTGYRLGREMHRVRKDISRNRTQVRSIEEELAAEDTAKDRKVELRYQLRSLEQDFGRMQSRLEYLEVEERRVVVSDAQPFALNLE